MMLMLQLPLNWMLRLIPMMPMRTLSWRIALARHSQTQIPNEVTETTASFAPLILMKLSDDMGYLYWKWDSTALQRPHVCGITGM